MKGKRRREMGSVFGNNSKQGKAAAKVKIYNAKARPPHEREREEINLVFFFFLPIP